MNRAGNPGGDQLGSQQLTIQQALDFALQHHSAGDLPKAESIFQQILLATPRQPIALNMLGVIAHQVGKNEMALELITKALDVSPDYAWAHYNLGLVLKTLGRLDEAVDRYHNAINITPDFSEAHTDLGLALQELGRLDEAVVHYRKAIDFMPGYVLAHNNLGVALQKLGRIDEAVDHYHKAIDIKPDYADANNNLGLGLTELGRLDEAVDYYHKAVNIDPDFYLALFNLHAVYYGNTDLEPAARCLEKASKIAPDDRKVQFFLGMIRDYQGHAKQAKTHFGALKNGTDIIDPRLDSWRYIKSSSANFPRLFGGTPKGLQLGLEAAQTDGLVMEFGVRFGTTIRQLSTLAGQDVHGFDSFQGLPEAWHYEPKGTYSTHGILPEVPENVHLHVGLFETSLPPFLKEHTDPIRFLNIDCDLYSSTKTVLDLLGDRIVSGTVIVFDEYFGFSSWREDEFKAFQEAVEKFSWQYDYVAVSFFSQQAVVIIR